MRNRMSDGIRAAISDLTVLYVEDEDEVRERMASYLARRVGHVHTAGNGQVGLGMFRELRPQLVISDIRMPLMDGISMCREIRKIDPGVSIILTSAHNESDLLLSSIDLGVAKYVVKPVRLDVLMAAVADIAGKVAQKRQLETQMRLMNSIISEVEYENERVKMYVTHYLESGHHDELPNIRHLNVPKGSVSGDFFSIARYRESIYVLLADGAGHGLSAVMPALQVPRIFQQQAESGYSLLTIGDELNRVLREQDITEHFVAATLVRFSVKESFIEVLNCGNPPLLLVDESGKVLKQCHSATFPLGMVGSAEFLADVERVELQGKVRAYLFSDGLVDTFQALDGSFDDVALCRMISTNDPARVFDQLAQQVEEAVEQVKVDDITLLEILFDEAILPVDPPGEMVEPENMRSILTDTYSGDQSDKLLRKMRVLYVEDDDDTREYLARHLHRRVGMLYVAKNGREGLDMFVEYRPQLVVSDVKMPEMDGLEMVEEIRRIDRDVVIVMTSGSDDTESAERMFNMGVTRFQMKPVDAHKLIAALGDCLRQDGALAETRLSATVFESSPLAIAITDPNGDIVAVNPGFCNITGYGAAELSGRSVALLSSGKHEDGFYDSIWAVLRVNGKWSGEIWSKRKSGECFLEWLTVNKVDDLSGKTVNYMFVFSDIAARNVAAERLHQLVRQDSLTDLPNRLSFYDRLTAGLEQARHDAGMAALIYINIDNFRDINNALGFGAGDEILRTTARRLLACAREDDMVCRLGGDEFGILLLGECDGTLVEHTACAALDAISQAHTLFGQEVAVRVSMGVGLYPDHGEDAETLVRHACSAMNNAQSFGGNTYRFYDAGMGMLAGRRLALQQGMRNGLRNGEFYMVYQPKYSCAQDRIVGAEALMRWNNPQLGAVSPVEFIPVAEESDFVIELSVWMMDAVGAQLDAWRRDGGLPVPVSINISPLHLRRGNLIRSLQDMLAKWQIDPKMLVVEVTESMLMEEAVAALAALEQIKALGLHISIDDFGTGYSSLSYLRMLPIDELKIDRSFVIEIPESGDEGELRRSAIPRAIMQLANELGLRVVAEGVETVSQRDFLRAHGCDVIQGYLISKPVSAAEFTDLLRIDMNVVSD